MSCLNTDAAADTDDMEYVDHETRLVEKLLDPARYNKMVLPRWNRTYGVLVETSLTPMNLVEVVSIGWVIHVINHPDLDFSGGFAKPSMHSGYSLLKRKSRDYVCGIWQYKILSIKSYFRVKSY